MFTMASNSPASSHIPLPEIIPARGTNHNGLVTLHRSAAGEEAGTDPASRFGFQAAKAGWQPNNPPLNHKRGCGISPIVQVMHWLLIPEY